MGWKPVDKIAVALFNFPGTGEHHLPLEVGDMVCVLEVSDGWFRGHHFNQPAHLGIFPSSLVLVKDHTTIMIRDKSHLVPAEDEVTLEATHLLREWRLKLKEFYLSGEQSKYKKLLLQMDDVLSSRRHILKSTATHDVLQSMKKKLTAKLDQVNHQLGLPASPRDDNGRLLDCHASSLQRLYRVHNDRKKELDNGVTQTGALNRKQDEGSTSRHIHHLFMRVDKVNHDPPEECEVFFFLYDSESSTQISERFMTHAEASKSMKSVREQDKGAALFTDLGSKDLATSGMHLVCQLIRRGKMLLDDKKNIAQNPYRRPYACGVLEVSSLLQTQEDPDKIIHEEDFKNTSFSMPLYLCATNHESDFATFHTNIIKKTGGKSGQKPGCAISLTMKAFHGDLNEVRKNYPSTFDKPTEIVIVHKLGFPDVILPGDVRNDIYITLDYGTFEKGNKRSERNVEVAIEVVDGLRRVIPRAIILGAGGKPLNEYESFIFYHNNTPKWSETFKLSIPFEKLCDAHLRICFRHVAKAEAKDKSEKTFAFTFMKMMKDDGSIIRDGPHDLYVYKADHKRWFDPKTYLSYASCKDDVISNRSSKTFSPKGNSGVNIMAGGTAIARSFKETITLSTLTCSTKLTHKIELLMLLKWKQRERDLSVVLTNMLHISGGEVVKFLQDTLDCLFEILNTNQEVYGEKIFEVLVSIFGLMQDDKYQYFTTVLDIYISKHFSAILAHKFLIWCFEKHVREYGHIPKLHSKLCRVLKSMQYLFRFMIQSHSLYKKTNKRDDPTFPEELKQVFATLSVLMGYQENKVKDVYLVQSVLLANLPLVLPDVALVLSEDTIVTLISQFLDSIRSTHATLPHDKLRFMLEILDGPVKLFHAPGARNKLIQTFVSHLISYMDHTMPAADYRQDIQSNNDCMLCIARLLETVGDSETGATEDDIERVVYLILSLLRLSKLIPKNNPLNQLSTINMIGLLDVMHDKHFATFFASQKSTYGPTLKDFLMDFMMTLSNIIKSPLFPKTWICMFLIQSRVISRSLINISKALLDSFLDAHNFNPLIWDEFFSVCTHFVTQEFLQLEQFSDYRKSLYLQQFGDSRVTIGKQVILMWHKLRFHKGQFIPNLISSFLKISLLKQRELRRISIPLVFDVMKCEQQDNGNFKRVETEVFDKMDELLFTGQGDEEYKEMFSEILSSQCEKCTLLGNSGVPFIESVTRLIALLLDYRNVPADDTNRGRRMGCMLNLLHFYKDIDKEDIYVRYIYKLAELHEIDQNYTEAGFTLLLHAKGLEWVTDKSVTAVLKYPAQTAWARKELLYKNAINLFDRGKSWEHGIPLCKELAHLYETEVFDYDSLAAILNKQAEFFRKIIDIQQLRVAPEYFMVGYYGKGFPLFLRNKIFIHRGQPYEKLGAFIKRLTDEFVNAEVLKTTTRPESDLQNSNGMYLQLRNVTAVPKEHQKFKGKRVPDKIAEYYLTNEVEEFRYDRPFHKGKKNKECEFASLWIDRTTFTTVNSFPGVISWFEVSQEKELELDPLAIALETVESKNQEIQLQVAIYSADKSLSIHPLSMLLNGVIDAAVMGGIGNYEKIFFNPSYLTEHPEDQERVKKLRSLIEEQTVILEKALTLHGQRIDHQLQGLHSKLEQCFEDFQGIVFPDKRKPKFTRKVARSATIARPLPPTPLDNTMTSGPSTPGSTTPGMINTATLPSVMRRATGVPNRHIRTYEDTEINIPPNYPKGPNKATTPSPQHFTTRRSRETSPKVPSPYSSKKRLTVSSNTRQSGSLHSSNSSLNQSSDTDTDLYESVDFLKEDGSLQSQSSNEHEKPKPQTSFSPPKYPAPIPPKKNRVPRISEHVEDKVADNEDDDDDGYTQVNLEAGLVEICGYTDEVERAELPLFSSPSTRSSITGDSDTVHSSPLRQDRTRSPSAPEILGSPKDQSAIAKSKFIVPPEPTSPPPSPPYSRQGSVPINIKSPSPLLSQQNTSSLVGGQNNSSEEQPKLPPKRKNASSSSLSTTKNIDADIYAFDSLNPQNISSSFQKSSSFSIQSHDDDNIYTFDTLETPPPLPVKNNPRQVSSIPSGPLYQQDGESSHRFDNLEESNYSSKKTEVPSDNSRSSLSLSQSPTPSSLKSDVSEEPPPPLPTKKASAVSKSKQLIREDGGSEASERASNPSKAPKPVLSPSKQEVQLYDDADTYSFDSLQPLYQANAGKNIGTKPMAASPSPDKPGVQMFDDKDIYSFDSLQPLHQADSSNLGSHAVHKLSPETGQSSDASLTSDQAYFDHLFNESSFPPPPNKPPPQLGDVGGGNTAPLLPPKASPPVVKKRVLVKGTSSTSISESAAPPLPAKKRGSKNSVSADTTESTDSPDVKPRPVPRPRGTTFAERRPLEKPSSDPIPSLPPRPSNPQLPPKPSIPIIPPKPGGIFTKPNDSRQAPPIPSKGGLASRPRPPKR